LEGELFAIAESADDDETPPNGSIRAVGA